MNMWDFLHFLVWGDRTFCSQHAYPFPYQVENEVLFLSQFVKCSKMDK